MVQTEGREEIRCPGCAEVIAEYWREEQVVWPYGTHNCSEISR